MSRPTVVAFDLMDTVLVDPYRPALEAATGLPVATIFARRDKSAYPAFECAQITEEEFWARHRASGIPVNPATFHSVRRQHTRFVDGMEAILDALATRVQLVTASNYPIWIEELAEGLLAGRFDRVLASHHLGARKPDAAFYQRLLDVLDVPAASVAFIDDRAVNVDAARDAGIRGHRFTTVVRLKEWLAQQGLAP